MEEQHPALGRLRGKTSPPSDVLDRLYRHNAQLRVSWLPNWGEFTGCWGLYLDQERTDPRTRWLCRETAWQRRRLYLKYGEVVDAPLWFDLEAQLDGHMLLCHIPDPWFGTLGMFDWMEKAERTRQATLRDVNLAAERKMRQKAIAAQAKLWQQYAPERVPEAREALRALYPEMAETNDEFTKEFARKIIRASVSKGWTPQSRSA